MAVLKSVAPEVATSIASSSPVFHLVFSGFLNLADLRKAAGVLSLVSSLHRFEVLIALACGERSTFEIAASLEAFTPTDVGRAIRELHEANLVKPARREGRQNLYRLTETGHQLAVLLKYIVSTPQAASSSGIRPQVLALPAGDGATNPGEKPDDALDASARLLKAFGDPVRLRLLNLLSSGREVCICHLQKALGLPQTAVTRHLRHLANCRVVDVHKRGRWVYYRLSEAETQLHRSLLSALTSSPPGRDEAEPGDDPACGP
jgi:ArsR family transcriptional regulator